MKIIYNKFIPFGSFKAMAVGPIIFAKSPLNDIDIRHESIHWEQEKELAIIGFYLLYVLMFVWEFIRCIFDKERGASPMGVKRSLWDRTYRSIAFEREAYQNERYKDYIKNRRHYAWIKS